MRFDPSFVAVKRSLIFSQIVSPPCVAGVERVGRGGGGKGGNCSFFSSPSPSPFCACHPHYKIIGCPLILSFSVVLMSVKGFELELTLAWVLGSALLFLLSFAFSGGIYRAYRAQKKPASWPFFHSTGCRFCQVRFQKIGQTYIVCSGLRILFFYTNNSFSVIPLVYMLQSLTK